MLVRIKFGVVVQSPATPRSGTLAGELQQPLVSGTREITTNLREGEKDPLKSRFKVQV